MKQDESKLQSSGGFTFVTVAPKSNVADNPTMRRLRAMQDAERANYRGASTVGCGRAGNGLNAPRAVSAELACLEEKGRQVLEELLQNGDFRPILITFTPITEGQLVKGGPPQNIYAKGNFLNHKELLYRVFKADARLVRSVLESTGFGYTDSHDWNIMWLGTSAQQYLYEGLNEYQKINHFPNSFEITRKDRFCLNIMKMQRKYGKEAFDFIPETYVLPDEYPEFYQAFHEDRRCKWIVKPSCSSQGRGIYIVESMSEVPISENCIISKYVQNPLLINGLKFDLRIYVLVTGFDPLKIYVYDEGLARFASEPYNPDTRKNRYAHLTNYSVNKKNEKFVQNQDAQQDDVGHKWSLSALFRYLEAAGVDIDFVWNRIYDMIVKSIISIEPTVVEAARRVAVHRNNCFDLFGFDVLIDSNLKPWLLEVNLSPSLAADSPLDLRIKGHLISDTFNLIGIRLFDRKKENMNKVKARIRARQNQANPGPKMSTSLSVKPAQRKERDVSGTAKMREILKEALEEYERRGNFLRIYPSPGTEYYDQFFSVIRSFTRGLQRCLLVEVMNKEMNPAPPPLLAPVRPHTSAVPEKHASPIRKLQSVDNVEADPMRRRCSQCQGPLLDNATCTNCRHGQREGKLVITGDDILMEYISRLIHAIKAIQEDTLKVNWKRSIEKFICHYVWHAPDSPALSLWERLDSRVHEMKERQKRLLSAMPRRKSNQKRLDEQKQIVIRGFSASQLEGMLRSSTKNVAQEVVSCLINAEGRGVLTDIIKWLAATAATHSKPLNEPKFNEEASQKRLGFPKRPFTSGKY